MATVSTPAHVEPICNVRCVSPENEAAILGQFEDMEAVANQRWTTTGDDCDSGGLELAPAVELRAAPIRDSWSVSEAQHRRLKRPKMPKPCEPAATTVRKRKPLDQNGVQALALAVAGRERRTIAILMQANPVAVKHMIQSTLFRLRTSRSDLMERAAKENMLDNPRAIRDLIVRVFHEQAPRKIGGAA